jgi:hypothetical protein
MVLTGCIILETAQRTTLTTQHTSWHVLSTSSAQGWENLIHACMKVCLVTSSSIYLLSSYIGFKDNWAKEGIATYAESDPILGYSPADIDPTDNLFSSHLKVFLGFEVDNPDLGGPEQSLS